MKIIVDGNTACSKIAYLFSEVVSIYPITPSSPMASNVDKLTETDYKNLFNDKPVVIEMQSEAGAAGALHGALLSGSLATTFTASQGLLLMVPNMYKIAGEMLPAVIHVAARSLATHSLSIFGDQQDIYATRQTGFCILASSNVYDAQNLAAVAHLSAIEGSLPFLHFFDGFRTSHELNTISELPTNEVLKLINYDKINEFKNRMLNLECGKQFGLNENEDIYFQSVEARNINYLKIPDIVNVYMQKINKIMNMDYKPFNYYGKENAENIIIAMGSVCDTIKEVIDDTNDNIGLIEVHLYRPFSKEYLIKELPKTVKNIAVLDRTKEFGSNGEPLYLDIVSALSDKNINIVGGRYGLSSKNTTPSDIYDVFYMLSHELKNNFTIGIVDDLTHLSLEKQNYKLNENTNNIKIYGFGSDGMVSASKEIIKLIMDKEKKFCQGYFEYDSKKSGGVTVSNLRISDTRINKPYYVESANLLVVTKYEYFYKYDMLKDLKKEGILLINTNKSKEEILTTLPYDAKKILYDNNVKVYYLDAEQIAINNNIKGKISKIMEMAIFKLLNMDYEKELKENIKITFKSKGEEVVNNNIKSAEETLKKLNKLEINNDFEENEMLDDVDDIFSLIRKRKGYNLTVKDVENIKGGEFPWGLSKKDKRNISNLVPKWKSENCVECGLCSLVCPHAVIRPYITKEEGIDLIGNNEYKYSIKISEKDCTGCSACINVCPGKNGNKALEMVENNKNNNNKYYFEKYENPEIINKFTIKGSQFQKPLFEFSGACAGCGETPYIKLLTQLFGKNIVIANATGCSSIYGGSAPSTPYMIPWANSLFEDNAEFALGIHISYKQKRSRIKKVMEEAINSVDEEVKNIFKEFLSNFENDEITIKTKELLKDKTVPKELKDLMNYIPSRTVWAIGGDGWAYDIGYGGLDHVLHSNENIKVLVLDTEVYSNTGGQASKSTKLGAVAEFANLGKKTNKKDLFKIAMCIPNCYVASVSLGASPMQTIKAFKEAEEHNGPAIIIAYAPCIEQGLKKGMNCAYEEEKLSVECGYNILMRYDTENLFIDSPSPNFDKYLDFLNSEIRFNSLYIKNKTLALSYFEKQKEDAINRYNYYLKQNKK